MAIVIDGTSGLSYTGDSSGAQSLSVPQSVGIGTTSPSARLEVKGSSSDNATININNNSGNIWKLWNDNGASALNIQYNGTTRVVVNSSGSLGIGTTSPSAKLHVLTANPTAANEVARFQGGSDASNYRNYISLYTTNPSYWWEFSNQDVNGTGGTNGIAFIENSGGTATNRVYFAQGGNVMIGGTSITTNNGNVSRGFNVYGTNNVVIGGVNTNVNTGLIIEGSRTGRATSTRYAQIVIGNDSSDNGYFQFQTALANNDVVSRLAIDYNGVQSYNIAGFAFTQFSGVYTPTGKTRVTYVCTGAQQTFVVPGGITYIFAKLWGAGAGGGSAGGWGFGSQGGGGGHAYGIIPVTPGATYYIVVGAAGQTNYAGTTTLGYGGGGGFATNSDNRYASSGGGYTGIFNNVTPSQGAALLIAGGGGGGGSSRQGYGNVGGAGGGSTGQDGGSPYDAKPAVGGKGGTQSAGGTAGTGAQAGGALFGGYGGTTGSPYGGGGGGGYWGGGGGGYSESNTMAGGAGGSGFVGGTVLMGATFTGNGPIPAFSFDNDLSKSIDTYRNCVPYANGGSTNQNTTVNVLNTYGGSGYVVIYY